MSLAMRNFVLQQKRAEASAPADDEIETKRGMLGRGGSRGAFRRMGKLHKQNRNAYYDGKIQHPKFNSRWNRINKAQSYLMRRGRRPGNRRVRSGDI